MNSKRWRLAAMGGFALGAGFAIYEEWKLPELCWSFWLTGLFYSWTFVLVGGLRILLLPTEAIPARLRHLLALARLPVPTWRAAIGLIVIGIAFVMFHLYAWLFGFYGVFLSVFAEMQPHALFGRNGFINSDFYTPVAYLAERFWPMVLGALATDIHLAMTGSPWQVPFKPFSRQLVLIHVMVIGVPFISLFFWWLLGERYHLPAVVLVLALFYFLPRRGETKPPSARGEAGSVLG